MISTPPGRSHVQDVEYHLQCASRAFYANKYTLTCRRASMKCRLQFFVSVVTSVACFGACHRALYKEDLDKMDVVFRRLLRQVVGPPAGVNWNAAWHDVLHVWHDRVNTFLQKYNVVSWSETCLGQHWDFASYVARLPACRWVRRLLSWEPSDIKPQGRPRNTWETKLVEFCSLAGLGDWWRAAQDVRAWQQVREDFIQFAAQSKDLKL